LRIASLSPAQCQPQKTLTEPHPAASAQVQELSRRRPP